MKASIIREPGQATARHSRKDLLEAAHKLQGDVDSAVTAAATYISLPNVIPGQFTDLDDVVDL